VCDELGRLAILHFDVRARTRERAQRTRFDFRLGCEQEQMSDTVCVDELEPAFLD